MHREVLVQPVISQQEQWTNASSSSGTDVHNRELTAGSPKAHNKLGVFFRNKNQRHLRDLFLKDHCTETRVLLPALLLAQRSPGANSPAHECNELQKRVPKTLRRDRALPLAAAESQTAKRQRNTYF